MKLYNFLKEYGMFANELKTRLKNKQIKVNGVSQDASYDLGNVSDAYDQGFFLEELYKLPNYDKWEDQIMMIGLANLMGGESNIENELTNFLKDWKMIQIAKEKAVFIKTTDKPTDKITFYKEGEKPSEIEIEIEQEETDNTDLINKLQSDKAKVEKQLSNQGFVNNAPKFKVDAAKNRLEVLTKKLQELGVNENRITRFKDFG